MGMDPVAAFTTSLNNMNNFYRGRKQDERNEKLFNMKMEAYQRDERDARQEKVNNLKKRELAGDFLKLNNGNYGGADIARWSPDSASRFEDIFNETSQQQAFNYVMPLVDKGASGQPLNDNEREPLWALGGALWQQGILAGDVAGIREQAIAAPALKNKIVTLAQQVGPRIMGKRIKVTEQNDPELFHTFSKALPAIANNSKVFKDGKGKPVEFYIDATETDNIQDASVITVIEGINQKTGKAYRAPVSRRRSNDPNDIVESARLKDLYAQADFAEKTSKALEASWVKFDDAAAQRVLDRYRDQAQKVAEQFRTRKKAGEQADSMSKVLRFGEQDSKDYRAAIVAGADPTATAKIIIERNNPKVDLEVIKDIDVNGKPHMIFFDKKSRKRIGDPIPQWDKSSGSNANKNFSGLMDKLHSLTKAKATILKGYDPMTGELLDQSNIDAARDAIDAQITNTERYMSRVYPMRWNQYSGKQIGDPGSEQKTLSPEQRLAIYKQAKELAKQEADKRAGYFSSDSSDFSAYGGSRENFINQRVDVLFKQLAGEAIETHGKGNSDKSLLSQLPGGDKAEDSASRVVWAIEKISDDKERETMVQEFLNSPAPNDVKRKFKYLWESKRKLAEAEEASKQRINDRNKRIESRASVAGGMTLDRNSGKQVLSNRAVSMDPRTAPPISQPNGEDYIGNILSSFNSKAKLSDKDRVVNRLLGQLEEVPDEQKAALLARWKNEGRVSKETLETVERLVRINL